MSAVASFPLPSLLPPPPALARFRVSDVDEGDVGEEEEEGAGGGCGLEEPLLILSNSSEKCVKISLYVALGTLILHLFRR